LYGSSAIGGVVNFITEKNRAVGFNADLYSQVSTLGNGAGEFSQNLFLNYTFLNGFYINGEVFNSHVQGIDATVDTITNTSVYNKPDKDNFNKTDIAVKTGFINNDWDISLSYRKVKQEADIDKRAYVDDDNASLDFDRASRC